MIDTSRDEKALQPIRLLLQRNILASAVILPCLSWDRAWANDEHDIQGENQYADISFDAALVGQPGSNRSASLHDLYEDNWSPLR